MRTFKFRVWYNNEFYYTDGSTSINIDRGGHTSLAFPILTCADIRGGNIIQQFTGLKDHKKVECYEGDIVRYFNLPPFEISYGLLGEVTFLNGCFCIKCRDKSKGGNVSWITDFDELDYFEVIGNIYETPELLK